MKVHRLEVCYIGIQVQNDENAKAPVVTGGARSACKDWREPEDVRLGVRHFRWL